MNQPTPAPDPERRSPTWPDPDGAITLRPEESADEIFLFEVYASTRQDELDATGWDAQARAAFLDMQFRAMRQGYAGMFPRAAFSIVLLGTERAGRLVVNRTEAALHIVDLALLPAFRNRGIGTALLHGLLAEAAPRNQSVLLEMLKGARAHPLYERLGFRKVEENELFEAWRWMRGA